LGNPVPGRNEKRRPHEMQGRHESDILGYKGGTDMKRLFAVLYFLSPFVPAAAIYSAFPGKYANTGLLIPMLLGCMTFTWLMTQFLISSRPKWIERFIGLDRMFRFHSLVAILAVMLGLVHRTIMEEMMGESFMTKIATLALIVFIGISALALVFMADLLVRHFRLLAKWRKILEKNGLFRYQVQLLVHNLSLAGGILIFIHVMLTTSARTSPLVTGVFILYFAIGMGSYAWHKVLRPAIQKKNGFRVREVVRESESMWTLVLEPARKKAFTYKAGQFGFLRIFGSAVKPEEHPFSFSSNPENPDVLSVTIKELGDYTRTIRQIRPGDIAAVDGPYGAFTPARHNHAKWVLIAGGIGITPMLSILNSMKSTDPDKSVLLLWGINNAAEIIRKDEFEEMQKTMPNLKIIPVAFRDEAWQGERGAIDTEKIQRLTQLHGFSHPETGYYICGPAIMLNKVLESLKTLRIEKSRIHFERFSL
jgi:predicted ferric reductase